MGAFWEYFRTSIGLLFTSQTHLRSPEVVARVSSLSPPPLFLPLFPFVLCFLTTRGARACVGDPLSPDGLDVTDDGVDAQPAEVLDPQDLLIGEAVVGRLHLDYLQLQR